MARLVKIGVVVGAGGGLYSIGALDPKLWADVIRREREQLPGQIKEALAAGRRAAERAEEDLDREVREAFEGRG